ncbi:MAG: hypothetical protein K6C08_07850 [Oscillospiraceae bacterium]|nr:hypothetical protein [Oscillospiraceae bacterium]
MRTIIPKDFLAKVNVAKLLRYALFLLLSLVFQDIISAQLRIFGVCPMALPAVAVAMGMFEGATWGPLFSLLLGVFADMTFIEHQVFFSLLFPILSFLAAFVSNYYINRRFFAYMGAASVGLLITGFAQALKTAAGEGFSTVMLTTALLQTLWSLPFAAAAYVTPARLSKSSLT